MTKNSALRSKAQIRVIKIKKYEGEKMLMGQTSFFFKMPNLLII